MTSRMTSFCTLTTEDNNPENPEKKKNKKRKVGALEEDDCIIL